MIEFNAKCMALSFTVTCHEQNFFWEYQKYFLNFFNNQMAWIVEFFAHDLPMLHNQ